MIVKVWLYIGKNKKLCVSVCLQLVLDSQKRVFSWGFGGYGRLGHTEQKDEMVPRLVKLFDFPGRGASQIHSGYQCSFAVSEMGRKTIHRHTRICAPSYLALL